MGNTTVATVIISNDRLDSIADDKNLGRNLAEAVLGFTPSNPQETPRLPHMRIISRDSSYGCQIVLVTGNSGRRIPVHVSPDHCSDEDILRAMAAKQGFRLVRKKPKT